MRSTTASWRWSTDPARCRRLQRCRTILWNHFEQWFAFVVEPEIEPTNWKAEQAIRPAVVNRKVWGGNRTATGAQAQSIAMSVVETCRRESQAALEYISQTLRAAGSRLLSRPVLLTTR